VQSLPNTLPEKFGIRLDNAGFRAAIAPNAPSCNRRERPGELQASGGLIALIAVPAMTIEGGNHQNPPAAIGERSR
jgi:hypothetical protein